jgi:hypothetical protein
MRIASVISAVACAALAACGSKLAGTTTGTGGAGGAAAASTGTATATGTGATTTSQTSGTTGTGAVGGAGGTTTTGTTTATTGSSTTTTTGAGGSCTISPKFTEVLSKPLSSCAGFEPPCHNAGAGGLTITPTNANATYAQLVNVPAMMAGAGVRVVPGDPASSFVYRKLTNDLSPSELPPMPEPPGNILNDAGWQELPAADIEIMRCWIQEGAKNN